MTTADDRDVEGFSVSARREGARGVIALVGELDLHTAGELTTVVSGLLEQNVTRVEVDAGGLSFADSAGLRAVLMARAAAEEAGASFGVTVASDSVERLIEITGLSELLIDQAQ
ncbi:MAG: STAS domain-containing protein [Acidimicrobiales bacterium]